MVWAKNPTAGCKFGVIQGGAYAIVNMYRVIKGVPHFLLLLFTFMRLLCWFNIAARLLLNIAQLERIDNEFMAKASDDFNITQQDIKTQVASITTRDIQAIDNPAAGVYTQVDIPEAYRIDAKPFIERPFYCDTVAFKTTDAQYSLLASTVRYLPGDVARSNTSLLNMFKMAALGRPDLVLNLSMAGTISHAGCVLVGVIPPMPAVGGTVYPTGKKQLINTIMSGPHAFLNANEATSVTLHVPWYCNNDMMSLDFQKGDGTYFPASELNYYSGNFGTLVMMVLNQLNAAAGASTTINIVIEACFKNFDMVIPTPRFLTWSAQAKPKQQQRGFIDSLKTFTTGLFDYTTNGLKSVATDGLDSVRGWLRSWTGLHNPNLAYINERVLVTANNYLQNTSTPQFFEKMDLNPTYSRVVKEPLFGSTMDEMAISHITAKDQYLGTFSVSTTDVVGKLVWIRPISPFSGGVLITDPVDATARALQCHNNLDLLHSISRAWRGGLKLKIQSVMNNKQQVKLKVIKYYNPSYNVLTKVPDYKTIVNAPSHLLEYTQGGQMHEVALPYLCRNELTPCHDDPNFEALFHGVYYIYVAQPLCVADGSPTSVSFNVYICGDDDLAFYGQNIRFLQYKKWDLVTLDALASTQPAESDFRPESGTVSGMEVMNAPQEQPQDMGRDDKSAMAQYCNRLLPHVDIRPYVRRMYPINTLETSIDSLGYKDATVDLATLLLERYRDISNEGQLITPLHLVSAMYYGKTPGFKIRVTYTVEEREADKRFTVDDIVAQAFYIPPQICHGQQQNQMMFQTAVPIDVVDAIGDNPVPLIVSNQQSNADRTSLECEVPFTHLMRFFGGPDKFRDFDQGASAGKLTANSDLGAFQISFFNKRSDGPIKVVVRVYAGVNDETRFGMHSIAPIFYRKPSSSLYTTNFSGTTQAPDNALPATLYRGGYA